MVVQIFYSKSGVHLSFVHCLEEAKVMLHSGVRVQLLKGQVHSSPEALREVTVKFLGSGEAQQPQKQQHSGSHLLFLLNVN